MQRWTQDLELDRPLFPDGEEDAEDGDSLDRSTQDFEHGGCEEHPREQPVPVRVRAVQDDGEMWPELGDNVEETWI